MQHKQTKAVLVRMPSDLFKQKSAHKHRRSNTQELIVAIENRLNSAQVPIREPHRLKFREKISKKDLIDAIDEGRE